MTDTLPPLTRWNSAAEPKGCVQIVHGMHELVNETNRDTVTEDVIAWLDTRLLANRGSSAKA